MIMGSIFRNMFFLVVIANAVATGAKIAERTYGPGWFIVDMIILLLFLTEVNIKKNEQD